MTGVEKAKKKTAMRPDPIADAKVNRKSRPWVIAASADRAAGRRPTGNAPVSLAPCRPPFVLCIEASGARNVFLSPQVACNDAMMFPVRGRG
jgi:hypothetical protein